MNKTIQVTMTLCKCLRCGYKWASKQKRKDIIACARCKTRSWNIPRKKKRGC